jgi:Immunoglobulin domain
VKGPASFTIEEGGDVQLKCSAKGFPTPTIQWLQNGESVNRDPHINTQGGVLNITLLEKRHAGIFQCFATNSLGSAYGLAMLQVMPKTINSRPHMDDFGKHKFLCLDLFFNDKSLNCR